MTTRFTLLTVSARVLLCLIALLNGAATKAQSPNSLKQAPPELVLQRGHASTVNAIALDPAGALLVSADTGGGLAFWRYADGTLLRRLEYGASIAGLRFAGPAEWP